MTEIEGLPDIVIEEINWKVTEERAAKEKQIMSESNLVVAWKDMCHAAMNRKHISISDEDTLTPRKKPKRDVCELLEKDEYMKIMQVKIEVRRKSSEVRAGNNRMRLKLEKNRINMVPERMRIDEERRQYQAEERHKIMNVIVQFGDVIKSMTVNPK